MQIFRGIFSCLSPLFPVISAIFSPPSAGQPFSFHRRSWDKAHRRQAAFHSDNGNRLLHGRFPIRVWLIMLSFIDLPTVSFHSGPAVAGANGDTSGSMTGRDPARRNSCLSWNRKSPLCVCPGRPLSDPPGRTLILPLLHTFYTHPVFPLISSPECFFLLAMPSGFVGRKGLSSCLNCPD